MDFLSQMKHVLDLFTEIEKMEAKQCSTSMVPNVHIIKNDGDLFDNPERYTQLVGRLIYLIATRPNIGCVVSVVGQFMSALIVKHWEALEQTLCYSK